MKKTLLALCLAPSLCFAQSVAINGKEGYRKLTTGDFKGAPDKNTQLAAMSYYTITWKVDTARSLQNKTAFPPLKVLVNFTGQSWMNTQAETAPSVVHHEQGHFDIIVVCAAELQRKFNDTTFDAFETAMPAITRMYRETLAKCDRMRRRYEAATNNNKNASEQRVWDNYLDKEITRYLKPEAQ